ncbi:uncharacterized protein N7459_009087 [Penicillium hispanicum]|uniref:uncharacterized protein n=1 Tax=Penicillium hispanicum TaxID=1080232 RepID=UPI00253FAA91|nr:uncharacterized protein N7459_009087 [Penicillium hispanicum]KAJ5569657.1 hypothetical protein N7459_009087 [Penicillium hispanicum]
MERPAKRARVSPDSIRAKDSNRSTASASLASLHRSVTPPPRTRSRQPLALDLACPELPNDHIKGRRDGVAPTEAPKAPRIISSPFQLTHIHDLPSQRGHNVDTVKLRDILGDPMIRECWQFNYLFDVDFLMAHFDEDVRSLVQVKVVHGSWERESANKVRVDEACSRHPNVEAIVAYMPERFGTHHSKMMILLRHDDLAQIVIHTANMIHQDWANMTQAVWRSPLLPLQKAGASSSQTHSAIGTGTRFKRDLLSYLKAYGAKKTGALVQQLNRYDFGEIRAALVASVPSKQKYNSLDSDKSTLWGWPALRDLISRVPILQPEGEKGDSNQTKKPHIVIQISSVASLGQTDKWLNDVFFNSLAPKSTHPRPKYSIIFPTPDEIRRSLDGYMSGGSIHMKIQSAPQQKQLQYLRPHLCHWAGDGPSDPKLLDLSDDPLVKREAGRGRAAPHIKTYIRYSDAGSMDIIDWAMVTSANLSTQAWGAATNASDEVRISSWEIGVVVWPELFTDDFVPGRSASASPECPPVLMVPCFQRDKPATLPESLTEYEPDTVVGLRMPYDLPLVPYSAADEPWCATATHDIPDWRGRTWI